MVFAELLGAVQDYKAKAETYLARFEAGEVARAKAVRAESLGAYFVARGYTCGSFFSGCSP